MTNYELLLKSSLLDEDSAVYVENITTGLSGCVLKCNDGRVKLFLGDNTDIIVDRGVFNTEYKITRVVDSLENPLEISDSFDLILSESLEIIPILGVLLMGLMQTATSGPLAKLVHSNTINPQDIEELDKVKEVFTTLVDELKEYLIEAYREKEANLSCK